MRLASCVLLAFLAPGMGAGHAAVVTNAQPVDRPMPDYPPAASTLGGHVTLRFGIGADGHTRDIHITQSMPAGMFDQAALNAVARWLYHPRLRNGRPVAQDNNAVNLSFEQPKPEPVFKPTLDYPRAAYAAHQEGMVTVGFDITSLGTTTNVHLLQSNPPGIFDKIAVDAVTDWEYAELPDGKPLLGQTADVAFTLADAELAPVPLQRIRLAYPLAAEQAGVMGNCNVGYWIEPDGTTSDAHILSCAPSGHFEAATLEAVRRATYRLEDDPRLNRRRLHKLSVKFRFNGTRENELSYLKPGQWVKLQFTRSATGHATDIKVADQSSPDVPTWRAVEQLRLTTLAPATENGRPVEQPNSVIIISAGAK